MPKKQTQKSNTLAVTNAAWEDPEFAPVLENSILDELLELAHVTHHPDVIATLGRAIAPPRPKQQITLSLGVSLR